MYKCMFAMVVGFAAAIFVPTSESMRQRLSKIARIKILNRFYF